MYSLVYKTVTVTISLEYITSQTILAACYLSQYHSGSIGVTLTRRTSLERNICIWPKQNSDWIPPVTDTLSYFSTLLYFPSLHTKALAEVFIFHNSGHEEFIKLTVVLFCFAHRPSFPCDTQKRESVVTMLN